MREKPSTSAGVLILKRDKILVGFQNRSHMWSIPKGGKENETYSQCWKRELKEETGIEIENCKYDIVRVKDIGGYNVTIIRLFSDVDLKPDGVEIGELKWATLEELMKLNKNAVTSLLCREIETGSFRNFQSCKKRLKS